MPPPVPPERERRTQDDREADLAAEVESVFKIVDQRRLRHIETDRGHRIFEQQPIFGLLDGAELRADELHVVLLEHAAVGEFDREVQRGLSADRGQQREHAGLAALLQHLGLDADDLFQIQ